MVVSGADRPDSDSNALTWLLNSSIGQTGRYIGRDTADDRGVLLTCLPRGVPDVAVGVLRKILHSIIGALRSVIRGVVPTAFDVASDSLFDEVYESFASFFVESRKGQFARRTRHSRGTGNSGRVCFWFGHFLVG